MSKEKILFIWKQKGKEYKNEVDRELFKNLMEAIKASFDWDNEVSSKLLSYIPNLECIEIDKDRNQQRDVPFIVCKMHNNTKEMLEIRNCHEIMWSILNKYTTL